MSNELLSSLELICNKNDVQDQKLLLLAKLVDEKYTNLEEDYADIKEKLLDTNTKIETLMKKLDSSVFCAQECIVPKYPKEFKVILFMLKNPKLSLLIVIGAVAVYTGLYSFGAFDAIANFFKLLF